MSTYAPILQVYPGIAYGMDDDSFKALRTQYQDTWQEMTGETATKDTLGQPLQTPGLSAGEWGKQLQNDKTMQDTYGWLKYGLSHKDFVNEQDSMQSAYGHKLDTSATLEIMRQQHEKITAGGGAEPQLAGGPPKTKANLDIGSSMAR